MRMFRMTLWSACVATALAGTVGTAPGANAAGTIVVAQDGTGDYRTVQAAINAVPTGGAPYVVLIGKGSYPETISVPAGKTNLTLRGATGNPEDVVITAGHAAWMTRSDGTTYGTEGSATATFAAGDFTATDLTIQNSYDPAANPDHGYAQAVAIDAKADRMVFRDDRFLGLQDTLLAWAPTTTGQNRQLFEDDFIEGNVDFLFGDATAVFYRDNVKLADRGAAAGGTNGYLAAPATDRSKTYGFLVANCTLSSSAASATFYLGRPWHPYSTADPQIVVRDTLLPATMKSAPWTTMSGNSFTAGRNYEYHNSGPGSGVNSARPQLTDAQAANYTPQKYLAGTDGWNPVS